ncbi:unnamed protein product [Effrenium voratum]|uniref:Uncharacterized protein n=1 Tax=Effrenium voratum TaxID=2562239 RepID=A0AA36JPE5_9DINO|nr:unnamed protein product [Effrenium voratum]
MPGRDRTAKRFVECTLFVSVVVAVFSLLEVMFGQGSLVQAPLQPQELLLQSLQRHMEQGEDEDEVEEPAAEAAPAPAPSPPLAPLAVEAEAPDAAASLLEAARLAEAPVHAETVLDPEQAENMKKALAAWLSQVASFHEVETLHLLARWLQDSPADEVNNELDRLVVKDPNAAWVTCASENELCNCASGQVRYGHYQKGWYTKKGKEHSLCVLDKFGKTDMAVGMLKTCQCHDPPDREVGIDGLRRVKVPATLPGRSRGALRGPGTLWTQIDELTAWIEQAQGQQILALSRVYQWLESGSATSKVAASVAKAARKALAVGKVCEDGREPNISRCSITTMDLCRGACGHHEDLSKLTWRPPASPRTQMCRDGALLEPLWSCDRDFSRVPPAGHPHEDAQKVLEQSIQVMCDEQHLRHLWATYLDCDFLDNYLRLAASEWLEEAYVTYVAGPQDSVYALQAVNLIRSIDLFSTRPVVVVVFDDKFLTPGQWRSFPNVIVYKMPPIKGRAVSFNFNKLRAMVAARVLVGIQLDTDQLISPGLDRMFASTRREIHSHYPWVMLPVHWMSRDAKKGELYSDMNFEGWSGTRTMRWGHAHPSWTYWALPFLLDLLYERFMASSRPGKIQVWDLQRAKDLGMTQVLTGMKVSRQARYSVFMLEDEDMLNVGLWRDLATKEWCKFDLEWALFKERWEVAEKPMSDSKWYPDGVPTVYLSMHNTKQFEITDWLLSWFARCHRFTAKCHDAGARGAVAQLSRGLVVGAEAAAPARGVPGADVLLLAAPPREVDLLGLGVVR